jgi:hypothetical protein
MSEQVELVARPLIRVETKVSQYERVSGGLAAGVIIMGLLAAVMFFIWYSMLKQARSIPDSFVAFAGENMNPEGVAEDVEEPGVEEFPEVQEPQLAEALESVDVISTVRANDSVGGDATQMGTGKGLGDRRSKGIGGGGDAVNKPWERWQILYSVSTMGEYAQQLDFFKIELGGAERVGDNIVYLTNVSGTPNVKAGAKRLEQRMYFSHTIPQLRNWDINLLRAANVANAAERIPVQFYPTDIINRLGQLESEQIQRDNKRIEDIKSTVFNVVGNPGNYRFELSKITYAN